MNTHFPSTIPLTNDTLAAFSIRMGLGCCIPLPDIALAGSPERSRERMAIQTEKGIFVLEIFSPDQIIRKKEIVALLFHLKSLGVDHILLPFKDAEGQVLFKHKQRFFQITPYIAEDTLPRPAYVLDAWRGRFFAEFLIDLLAKRHAMDTYVKQNRKTSFAKSPFDIRAYIRTLMQQIRIREENLHERLLPIQTWIENALSPWMEKMPVTFCHGDLHPVNALWKEKELLYVIDWEFCGIKPEIHDMATLLGCLGSEDPTALEGPFVQAFLTPLAESALISNPGWQALVPMVVAIRFCWLSEWLRKEDVPMIALEADYMELLVRHAPDIETLWHSLLP